MCSFLSKLQFQSNLTQSIKHKNLIQFGQNINIHRQHFKASPPEPLGHCTSLSKGGLILKNHALFKGETL